MHGNAVLANEIRKWNANKPHDVDSVIEAQRKGLIAPDPRTQAKLVLTSKGADFVKKWR